MAPSASLFLCSDPWKGRYNQTGRQVQRRGRGRGWSRAEVTERTWEAVGRTEVGRDWCVGPTVSSHSSGLVSRRVSVMTQSSRVVDSSLGVPLCTETPLV